MFTSGSMMGIRPAARICLPTSNCWATTASMPTGLALWMTERILVPKMPLATARWSSASSSGMGFISCTPSFSSARPLSTFRKGTTCFVFHRYCAASWPSNWRSIVISNRMAPSTRLPPNDGLVTMRLRMACTRSYICASLA